MHLRLNLKKVLLQKYDALDCQSTELSSDVSEMHLIQNHNAVLKKNHSAYHKTLALEFLSTQKVLHSTASKSHQLNNKVVTTIRKDNYFLLLDYFTNTILLSTKSKNVIKTHGNLTLKNYLVVSENPISFISIIIKSKSCIQ